MATTVAVLRAVLGLDDAGFKRKATAAEATFDELGRKAGRTGAALSIGLTAPLVLLGKRAVDLAKSFEKSMNVLQATSSATGQEMKALGDLAQKLGADVALPGTSASDAAAAMLELSKAGLTVTDVMGAARSTLQLSAAAQVDNARAAEIVGDSLNAFSLKGEEAGKVADLLSGAANASTGSIDEMASALAQSSSSFVEMGVGITDAVTAISLLAKAGIKGQDAGTSLKTALLRLNPTTKESKNVMKALGITFFDANGEFVGLGKSAAILEKAMGGLSQQNRQAALNMIGGSDAMRALSILARGGGAAFDEMRSKVSQAGSAAKLAGAQNSGLAGALDALQSTVDTVLTTAIQPFLGDLTNLAKRASDLAGKFNELDATTRKVIVFSAAGLALVGPTLLGLGAVANAIRALLPVLATLRTAAILTWATVSGPLAPLVIAILAAGLAIGLAWENNFGHIREVTAATWEAIKVTFTAGVEAVKGAWKALTSFMEGDWSDAFTGIKSMTTNAMTFISRVINPASMIAEIAKGTRDAVDAAQRSKDAASLFSQGRTMLPDIAAASAGADQGFKAAKAKAAQQAAEAALAAKKAANDVLKKPPHIAGMFDDLGKKAKKALTPLQEQMKSFATSLHEALTEQTMLQQGASDTAVRVANQFDLLSGKQKTHLTGVLLFNEGLRKQRTEMETARTKVEQLGTKLSVMQQKTTAAKMSFELFGRSIGALNAKQKELVLTAAQLTDAIEKKDAAAKKAKDAQDETNRVTALTNGLFKDAAKDLDLIRDGSLENKIAWDTYGKSVRDVTDGLNRHGIVAKAQAQRFAEMAKQVKEAQVPLGNFLSFIDGLISRMPQVPWEQNKAAMENWAEGMVNIGEKSRELEKDLSLMRDHSVQNRLSWELMGQSIENLDVDFLALIFDLAETQKQIDATCKKKDAIKDLADQTQQIFGDAILRLDEGFGGFFDGVISGFDKMLQDMAAQWLSAQIVKLIFGALGADTSGIDAGPLAGLFGGKRADGGDMQSGKAYMTGERGAELVFPDRNSAVISNADIRRAMGSGGGSTTVVQNISTPDASSMIRSRTTLRADALVLAEVARRRNG